MLAPRFTLPRGRRVAPRWVAVAVVVHAVGIAAVGLTAGPWRVREPQRSLSYLLNIETPRVEVVRMRVAPPPPSAPRRGKELAVPRQLSSTPAPDTVQPPPIGGPTGDSTGRAGGRPGGRGLAGLTPQFGDGRLWVRPLIIPEGGGRPFSLDSVVKSRMAAMADSIERHPMDDPNRNPYVSKPWTFTRNGRTYGIDAQGLHLGSFTIPTAALALLAFPQGNIDQSRANQALMNMRGDILRAAARAAAEDDFQQAVRDIRARKDRERREQRERDRNKQPVSP